MEELLPRNWAKSYQTCSESTTNSTDSELIHKIYNVVYRMLTFFSTTHYFEFLLLLKNSTYFQTNL